MTKKMTDALAICLESLERGDCSLNECLNRFPEYRTELIKLLETAAAMREHSSFIPRHSYRRSSLSRLLNKIRLSQPVTFWRSIRHILQKPIIARRFSMVWIIIFALVTSLVGGGTVYASGDALPGDMLYPVKLTIEEVQLVLSDDARSALLNIAFLQNRVEEIQTLIELGREDDLNDVLDPYGERISAAAEALAQVAQDDYERSLQLAKLLEQAHSVHIEVLTSLLDTVHEDAKPAIQRAIQVSNKGQQVVTELFKDGMPGGRPPDGIPMSPIDSSEEEGEGPPEWAGPPDWVGTPDWAGPPDWVGTPDWAGPPGEEGPPDWVTPPNPGFPPAGGPPSGVPGGRP